MRAYEIISEMASLGGRELFKYAGTSKDRIKIFTDKIKQGSPFKIKTQKGVEDVVLDPNNLNDFKSWVEHPSRGLTLVTTAGQRVPLNSIIKTKEFGGEEAGQRERIEQDQIGEIQRQLEVLKNGQPSIKINVGRRIVDVASVGKTTENVNGKQPKSDMTMFDAAGKAVAWVSLKGIYFRWGGWLHLTELPDIANWIQKIQKKINGNVFQPGMAFGHHISDEIKNLIVYGKDYGTGRPGISNVDLVIIGTPVIKKTKDHYELHADKIYHNGETPNGKDSPYLVLRYMAGRPDAGFSNARAETNTRSEGRKVIWLD